MLLWKCPNCRFFRLQIQYTPGCNQTVGIFLSMSLQLDTRAPSGDPRTPAGSLRGTGAAKPQGCSNSPSSPLWPTCEGPTLMPDLTPLPTSALEPQGDNTAEGTPAWDQGTTGGGTESRGMHPKSYSCLFFTCSMEESKPCTWDGYGAQRAEAIPLSWGPPARSPVKPRLLMQKGCQGMIWPLIYALHVAPKSCFHKINNFFFLQERHHRWTSGAPNMEHQGGRSRWWEQGCPQHQFLGIRMSQTSSGRESMHFFHYE